jgi:hypothetical protein
VKELRRRIEDLESSGASKEKRARSTTSWAAAVAETTTRSKVRTVEASSSSSSRGCGGVGRPAVAASTEVQVSIIESDALVELRCPRRDGLLLRVMQALHRDLGLEVTAVHASSAGDVLLVELRAKVITQFCFMATMCVLFIAKVVLIYRCLVQVKEVHGRRRCSINEVKRTIHLIISSRG